MLSDKRYAHRIISIGVYLPIVAAIVASALNFTGITGKFIEYSGIWFGDIHEFELHLFVGLIGAGACIAFAGGILLAKSRWKRLNLPSLGPIVVALVLILVFQVVFVWLTVVLPYQRERQIAAMIEVFDGKAQFDYRTPDWIPQLIQVRLPFFDRITEIHVHNGEAVLSDQLPKLGSLHSLESLDLGWTQITDVELDHLKGLTNLKKLFLHHTNVTDAGLKRLMVLSRLSVLYLDSTIITDDGLQHLKGLKNLQQLMLSETQISDTGLSHLKGLTSLRFLHLDSTKVTDTGIEHLKNVTSLDRLGLGETQITDAGLEPLNGLLGLRWLELQGTKITDNGLSHLSTLTGIGLLRLEGTQVTDAGLQHLKGLTSLTHLYLNNTQVTEEGREALRRALPKCAIY